MTRGNNSKVDIVNKKEKDVVDCEVSQGGDAGEEDGEETKSGESEPQRGMD